MIRERKKGMMRGHVIKKPKKNNNFLFGIGSLFGFVNPNIHPLMDEAIPKDDHESMKKDWKSIGEDFESAIDKIEEEAL